MIKRSISLLPIFIALTAGAMKTPAQQPQKSVLDGVYSEAQAFRGEAIYKQHCAGCHGENLDGVGAAPMLYSAQFLDRWRDDSLNFVANYVMTGMPLNGVGPGGLSRAQYVDVIAYLLWANEYPLGPKDLAAEDLEATLLVGPDGPKPLPPSALVRVVGCLAQPSGTWTLTRASGPARLLLGGDTTNAAELAKSAQVPLGTQEYRLPNLADDFKAAELTPQISKKVQVKGTLNGQGTNARINVLSFAPLSQDCGN